MIPVGPCPLRKLYDSIWTGQDTQSSPWQLPEALIAQNSQISPFFTAPVIWQTITFHHHLFPNKMKLYLLIISSSGQSLLQIVLNSHLLAIPSFPCHPKERQGFMAHSSHQIKVVPELISAYSLKTQIESWLQQRFAVGIRVVAKGKETFEGKKRILLHMPEISPMWIRAGCTAPEEIV